jgi:hypothetical protein
MTEISISTKGILGICDFATKTISITKKKALRSNNLELRRLTDLGEYCIKIAQTLRGKPVREEMQRLGLENMRDREYPIYYTDAHWFFGVIGGLEIYGSQLCDGPRYASVVDQGNEVFGYNCSEIDVFGKAENPAITIHIDGSWEKKIIDLYSKARRILTLEESRF